MKKRGFTLAEVLITLVIIGIIAAMTIPTLMNKTNEQETVVAVKKAYSILGQAYQRIVADNGELNPAYFGSSYEEATKNFGDMFVKYLNVQKNCGMTTDDDCFSSENGGMYKLFDGSDWTEVNAFYSSFVPYWKIRLADGMSVMFRFYNHYWQRGTSEELIHTIGDIYFDVNGDKGPNTIGKDVFEFWVTKYGVVPCGTPYDTVYGVDICRSNGRSCTAWIIAKGNMDYLRKEVSW